MNITLLNYHIQIQNKIIFVSQITTLKLGYLYLIYNNSED